MIGKCLAQERSDHADVGGHEREGGEDALGGDATDAAAGVICECGVGAVFGDAVEL
jgi:hypothetical protein